MKPFLKRPGGKSRHLKNLLPYIPTHYDTYFEPFLGGGALFFYLEPKKAVVSDIDPELINAYLWLKNEPEKLFTQLRQYEKHSCKEFYDIARLFVPINPLDRAAHYIYIVQSCYRGMFRVNKQGKINAAYNKRDGFIFDFENAKKIADFLNKNDIEIVCTDYRSILKDVTSSDFVFLDPPYADSEEKVYTARGFDSDIFAKELLNMDKAKIPFLACNRDTPNTRKLFNNLCFDSLKTTFHFSNSKTKELRIYSNIS